MISAALPDIDQNSILIFDLDNTLYPASCDLFSQVSALIGCYVRDHLGLPADKAHLVQKDYFYRYGTTLRGLMLEHQVDPADYLGKVHDIDLSVVDPAPMMDAALAALPCRKVIFTNASRGHAERVTDRLGIARHFDGIFDIVDAGFIPKPQPEPYHLLLSRHDIDPTRAVFFEDMAKNLLPARDLGMTTVLIHTDIDWAQDGRDDPRITHHTTDITGFLRALAGDTVAA
ncbi:MAG: pyrimidine 5'-nucleotidase [Pseudomonadota bacterium]